ncbi:MAG: serine/threonine protein kinase [Gemmatimonadetes bacterium]|nr:serine/threonine protein kinase [Gemmatimonadota bacterium]
MSNPGTGAGARTVDRPDELITRLTQTLEGRYKIGKMVGRGGMGAVFFAEDLTLERPVAIKVLPPEVSHDENLVERFEREARTAAKLDHPNIIPIFAVESSGDLHFFVMKYVSGESLEQVLARGAMGIEQAQECLWEASRALGHAHSRHVVHRDIKPGNIMLDHDGRAMLADFGISKAMQAATQLTATGQVIGTPFYMSPEQAKGQDVDGRSDQYSLAVVGFQMITGRMPFVDQAVHTIIYKHIFEEPPSIRELRPDCPAYLAAALHKALAKEPDARFATMEDFASAVMPHRRRITAMGVAGPSGEIVSPDAPTTITPMTGPTIITRKEPNKRRLGLATVFSALVIVTGGTGYWAWQEGMLEQFGLPVPGEGAQALDDPQASQLATAQAAIDSTARADSIAAAAAVSDSIAAAAAARDSAMRDSLAEVTRQLAAADRRNQRQRTQTPPARPAPQPQYGDISVNVLGNFGNVYIDDVSVGRTPLIGYRVTAGRHVIRIERQGCQDRADTVRVAVKQSVRHTVPLTCGG